MVFQRKTPLILRKPHFFSHFFAHFLELAAICLYIQNLQYMNAVVNTHITRKTFLEPRSIDHNYGQRRSAYNWIDILLLKVYFLFSQKFSHSYQELLQKFVEPIFYINGENAVTCTLHIYVGLWRDLKQLNCRNKVKETTIELFRKEFCSKRFDILRRYC